MKFVNLVNVLQGPEREGIVGKVLPLELKRKLFETAASKPEWLVAPVPRFRPHAAESRAAESPVARRWICSTEWRRSLRSKTAAGHRTIPLNGAAMAALARLLERARALGSSEPEHYVFPTCEHLTIDLSRPQRSWRTAWRKLVKETARSVGRQAARAALDSGLRLRSAISA